MNGPTAIQPSDVGFNVVTTAPLPPLPPLFPFTALVGQQTLQTALLLSAIDPSIGGVLISGPRGTAKSTSARALAALLGEGPFVNLPLGASESQLIGSLDLEAVLQDGSMRFSPGLLAKAHGGVLYVDEVNLLADALVDPLLDVAASGVNCVERENVSHAHAARFVLIGTMNPEEGGLRPQLSDRFGLAVMMENCHDPALRQRIVKTRLAFDQDPQAFCASYEAQQRVLAEELLRARERFTQLDFRDDVHAHVSTLCIAAGVDGLRADLVMLKAARALAALEGADRISVEHVARVAELVLVHRRQTAGGGAGGGSSDANSRGGSEANSTAGSQESSQGNSAPSQPGTQHGGSTPSPQPAQSDTHTANDLQQGGVSREASPDGLAQEDWGYVAPRPVASTRVKQTRPLTLKKV